ncbi:MAG: YceI family protein [Vulcanimicrobiaceae bacterium]
MLCAGQALANPRAIDVQNSKMTLSVFKQGAFSFLADNHEIDAPIASGSYDAATKTSEVTVTAAALKVLDPKLSADKRAQVQEAMSGPKVLDVERYPTSVFRSTSIDETGSHWKIAGNLTLHGETHPIVVDAVQSDEAHFTGSAVIRQTNFGIAPIKIAGGAVSVRDDVKLEFRIALM